MTSLGTPRTKLIAASVLLAGLIAAGASNGLSAATAARIVLAVAGLGALAFWISRQRPATAGAANAPRLRVQDRVGLNPRCGLALVAIDGNEVLVAYGEGFAEFHPVGDRKPSVQGRRPVRNVRRVRRTVAGGRS